MTFPQTHMCKIIHLVTTTKTFNFDVNYSHIKLEIFTKGRKVYSFMNVTISGILGDKGQHNLYYFYTIMINKIIPDLY